MYSGENGDCGDILCVYIHTGQAQKYARPRLESNLLKSYLNALPQDKLPTCHLLENVWNKLL